MLKLLLIAVVIVIMFRVLKGLPMKFDEPGGGQGDEPGGEQGDAASESEDADASPGEDTVFDEVCSTYLPVSKAVTTTDVAGKTHYFCSTECLQTFTLQEGKKTGSGDGNGKDGKKGYPFF